MGKKKPRTLISKKTVTEGGGEKNEEKQLEVKQLIPEKQTDVKQLIPEKQLDVAHPTDDPGEDGKKVDSDVPQETVSSTESRKRNIGATRGVCAMHKLHLKLTFLDRIATRTIFFLTSVGTLKPIAIELSLPANGPDSESKCVITPPVDATSNWMWQLAKPHVCSNDSGVHQLANYWLRTHACMEPFILSAHRQLSAMHPIYKLLEPRMRYTLVINAIARQTLISVDGVIESCLTPGCYCMEISASAYKNWRFDLEGLPADLIRRGMAEPDPTKPHGLKLLIEDYPYAADGLLIWDAIESWVSTYMKRYYTESSIICNDKELQAWYTESINVGHAHLRHESWWPKLATPEDLTSVLTPLIWLA
ncbi:linoleate 13S-lipoxygenase 3-1, chloroplastic-like [Apium graveolens]|uniref:linoleate 13S-lipoxygenase 3-1, chloroplastic-like n=1 Tax=Apium graveolens TaxID=4045 RepID=UPI003D7BE412